MRKQQLLLLAAVSTAASSAVHPRLPAAAAAVAVPLQHLPVAEATSLSRIVNQENASNHHHLAFPSSSLQLKKNRNTTATEGRSDRRRRDGSWSRRMLYKSEEIAREVTILACQSSTVAAEHCTPGTAESPTASRPLHRVSGGAKKTILFIFFF